MFISSFYFAVRTLAPLSYQFVRSELLHKETCSSGDSVHISWHNWIQSPENISLNHKTSDNNNLPILLRK